MSGRRPALLVLLVLLASCSRPPREETAAVQPPATGPRPELEQWDALIRLYETGQVQAFLEAGYLAQFNPPSGAYTHMETVEADFFDEQGEPTSHLVAESGRIFDQEREGRRRVKTWGGVVLTGNEGQTVRADTLWWDEARESVWTDGPVEVVDQGDVLRGIGFESDVALRNIHVYQGSGTFPRGGRWLDDERSAEGTGPTKASSDTSGARRDTTTVPPDSSRILPGAVTVRPDTVGVIPPERTGPVPAGRGPE